MKTVDREVYDQIDEQVRRQTGQPPRTVACPPARCSLQVKWQVGLQVLHQVQRQVDDQVGFQVKWQVLDQVEIDLIEDLT